MKKIICVIAIIAMLFAGSSVVCAHSGLTLTVANASFCNISEPVNVTVTLTDNCDKVQFFIEGILVDEKTGLSAGDNALSIDISKTPVLGAADIVAKTVCATPSEASAAVTLVKLKAVTEVFKETFTDYTDSAKNPGVFTKNDGGKGFGVFSTHTDGVSGNASKLTVNQQGDDWSAPYYDKGISVPADSIFTIETDFYCTDVNAKFALEARNSTGGYPLNGSSNMSSVDIFPSGGRIGTWGTPYWDSPTYWTDNTWYRVKIVFNDITNEYELYLKPRDVANSSYTKVNALPNITCHGHSKVRFTCYSKNAAADIIIDNVLVTYQQKDDILYMRSTYETSDVPCNADAFPVSDGTVKVAFSKAVADSTKMVSIKNALGDKITCPAYYDDTTNVLTITPSDKLNYDSEYSVCFEGDTAAAALNPVPRVFKTKKSDNRVENHSVSGTNLSVNVSKDASGTEYTMLAVYTKDGGVVSVNAVKVNSAGEYNLTMLNEEYDSVEFYIVDTLGNLELLSK